MLSTPRSILLLLLVLLVAPSATRGADDPLPSDPVFLVRLADGTSLDARLQRIGPDLRVTLGPVGDGAAARTLPLDEVVSLDRKATRAPALPEGPTLLFPDGERLRASIGKASDTAIAVQSASLGPIDVPLTSVLGLVLDPPTELEALEALHAAVRAEPGGREVAFLSNGDRLEGGFLGLAGDSVEFRAPAGATKLPRKGVVALAFDPKLVEYPRPRGTYLECKLRDGSRLAVNSARFERGELRGTARSGLPLRLPIADVDRLTVLSARVQYLSGRAEDAVKSTGYLGSPRAHQRDAAADGRPIQLAGQSHDRGLGTQARTLLAYRLDASARRFQATIGLDDRAGPLGDVVFRVRVDERVAYTSPSFTEGAPPVDLDIDVTGARFLILETDFGERGDVRDFADWAEARLVRDPGPRP